MKLIRWFGVVVVASTVAFGLLGVGVSNAAPGGPGGGRGAGIFAEYQTVLAQKLGISLQQLETAQKATRDQLIDQAVAAGKLTREQGDALKSGQRPNVAPGQPGQRQHGGMRNALSAARDIFEQHDTVLAQKLGISKDALDAAQKAARDQLIDQAVAAGKLTKQQADAMKSGQRGAATRGLRDKIGDATRAAATALKTTPEELRAALRNGQSLAEFAQTKGIDRASLRATVMATVQNEVNEAVRDGKLTSQQGTQIIDRVSKSLDRILDAKLQPGQRSRPGAGNRPDAAPGLQPAPNQR